MKLLNNSINRDYSVGDVIEDNTGETYIVVRVEKHNANYDIEYSGYGIANINSGQTFVYDSLEDLNRAMMSVVKGIVHGRHTVDFDIKEEEQWDSQKF